MKVQILLPTLLLLLLTTQESWSQIPILPSTPQATQQPYNALTFQTPNQRHPSPRSRSARPQEDWVQADAVQEEMFVFQHGFPYVSDSLVYSIAIDATPLIGSPFAPSKLFGRSRDGGFTWEPVRVHLPDSSLVLTADSMLTPVVLEAIGDSLLYVGMDRLPTQDFGALLRSSDAGDSWERLSLPGADSLQVFPLDIHFWDADTGVVFANGFPPVIPVPVQIYYTEDGGDSWTNVSPSLDSAESRWISQVQSLSDVQGDTIWSGTRFGRLLRSTNKGKDWEVIDISEEINGNVSAIAFRDAMNGLLAMELFSFTDGGLIPSVLMRTTDGGDTWEATDAPSFIEQIFYVEGSGGVYIGSTGQSVRPGFLISKDDGHTWTYDIPTPGGVAFHFPRPDFGLIGEIGFLGSTFKYIGPPLLADPMQRESLLFEGKGIGAIPLGASLLDMEAVDEQVILGVVNENSGFTFPVRADHRPSLLKSTDGGDSWELKEAEEVEGFISFDIQALSPDTIWMSAQNFDTIPGSPRSLFVSYDGGDSWTEKLSDIAAGVWVHFFDAQEGIVINRQSMSKTLDGGDTWMAVDSASLPLFAEGEFTTITNGTNSLEYLGDRLWFGTTLGRVFRSSDRGNTWEAVQAVPDSSAAISTLAFEDSLNGMAVLSVQGFSPPFSTTILRTEDGGASWSPLPPFVKPVTSISFIPGTESSYMVSGRADQFAAYTTDGGDSWVYVPDVHTYDGIDFLNPSTGYVFNKSFQTDIRPVMLKYQGDPFPAANSVSNEKLIKDLNLQVFPNPSSDRLSVESEKPIQYLGLIDIHGKQIPLARQVGGKSWTGNIAHLARGQYWLELHVGGKLIYKLVELR